ncbi:DUF4256 domain-containing protein [Chitinophaga sp. Hz27]|uniref:DUF4256 domain-containing protein n=1 Tax=Chitinophaga sp. Hz27 TaxID=3347169 RepID=UPI0035D886F1
MKNTTGNKHLLTPTEEKALMQTLQHRFEKHMSRHQGLSWEAIEKKLKAAPEKCWSLHQMEQSGGEPDVISYDKKNDTYTFMDCSPESPDGRRNTCFDEEARMARKTARPNSSAIAMAAEMNVSLLTEEQYKLLQETGIYDQKTSSWIQTPAAIRKLGGALFCDRRYNHVFIYHNGASSYYSARGFRAALTV